MVNPMTAAPAPMADPTGLAQQYEMIISRLNQELSKSVVLSQEYKENYLLVRKQGDELNARNE